MPPSPLIKVSERILDRGVEYQIASPELHLSITGVGGIESEEAFGLPIVSLNQNELAFLLLAA